MKLVVRTHPHAADLLEVAEVPIARADLVETIRAHHLSQGLSEEEADAAVEGCITGDTLSPCRRNAR